MPIFFQQEFNETTRLGIWKIEETEAFFKGNVPLHRDVTHPHKRLQHLAGRFLLQYLFPDFPFHLIEIADTRKPFLREDQYHFSISHCGDYAAAIVSKDRRVGIDIEIPVEKILKISDKFLNDREYSTFKIQHSTINNRLTINDSRLTTPDYRLPTLLWSAKEAVFKWYGEGGVDFKKDIRLLSTQELGNHSRLLVWFQKSNREIAVDCLEFDCLMLAWVIG